MDILRRPGKALCCAWPASLPLAARALRLH